ncbi:hypothetical protein Pfo_022576 [Paulownia fortunei]|nr:hypothetical protein Pfo_022576 [Paulownia fortunei]
MKLALLGPIPLSQIPNRLNRGSFQNAQTRKGATFWPLQSSSLSLDFSFLSSHGCFLSSKLNYSCLPHSLQQYSKNEYLFGRFDLQLKLVPGNSAGTVTTFFLSSQGSGHDEIDFEFLGNSSGEPYTVHTNVYAQGKGDKEQQFRLWFDPTSAFHTYSIVWNPQRIIFLVDNIPIRVFNNQEAIGTPFPKSHPMRVYCSLWNADDWATQGGRVKTDWTKAPFVASYRNFNINGCAAGASGVSCGAKSADSFNTEAWQTQELDARGRNRLRWVQQKYMIYNYCAGVSC